MYIMDNNEIEEFLKFAKENLTNSPVDFNYRSYILPHSEMRELLGKIIEEFQFLEKRINDLIKLAAEKKLYKGNAKFNFDKCIAASTIVNRLRNNLIENSIADKLISLIRFRNYIIHEYCLHNNRFEIENYFPDFLFMIFEANDYITNLINDNSGNWATHIKNMFDNV